MSRRDASTQDSGQRLKIDRPLRVLLVVRANLFPGALVRHPLDAFELIKSEITLQTLALRGGFLEDRKISPIGKGGHRACLGETLYIAAFGGSGSCGGLRRTLAKFRRTCCI